MLITSTLSASNGVFVTGSSVFTGIDNNNILSFGSLDNTTVFFTSGSGLTMINSGTNSGASSPDESQYSDVIFFVSGSKGSKNSSSRGLALFGGDLVVSGTLHGGSPLKIGSIPKYSVQNIDLGVASSATITPSSPVVFLDADSITENPSTFVFEASMSTSGFSDGETVKFVITTDVNKDILFVSGILSDATKTFGIPSVGGKGASFELIYVDSAASWAVLNANGLALF